MERAPDGLVNRNRCTTQASRKRGSGDLGRRSGKHRQVPDLQTAKDAGLDMVLFRSFNDNLLGFRTYLMQCASSVKWEEKRYQANISEWRTSTESFSQTGTLPQTPLTRLETTEVQSSPGIC